MRKTVRTLTFPVRLVYQGVAGSTNTSLRGDGVRGGSEIQLRNIRAHEGSQARAWEEITFQLRPAVGPDHLETRKTRAPDAGVEWYEIYSDGHQEGFQAKFNAKLQDALAGMRESVEAVAKKRPKLTKLTFIVPYDFTDSGESATTSDQDRWNDAVTRWRTDFPELKDVEFATIRAGDIVAALSRKEHSGRREYWFGALELTDDWFERRFNESRAVAGERYTPEADTPSSINAVMDAVVAGPAFDAELQSRLARVIRAAQQDVGIWGTRREEADRATGELQEWWEASFGTEDELGARMPFGEIDLAALISSGKSLLEVAEAQRTALDEFDGQHLRGVIAALRSLLATATGRPAKALQARAVGVVGVQGQGKTHALLRAVRSALDRGAPGLAILGERLSDQNWWPAVGAALGLSAVDCETFLQALDSLAEARGYRALIALDAINESQAPRRWQHELPALLTELARYRHLALIVTYRSDYREVVGSPRELLTLTHPGFSGNEQQALHAYCELFGIPVPPQALTEPAMTSPLFLRMYCEIVASEGAGTVPPTRSSLFSRYAEVRAKRVASKLGLAPTSTTVNEALTVVVDELLANEIRGLPRTLLEPRVDDLLPGRSWPNTLFQQMVSEGLIELRPTIDGPENVCLPFQAYSEHLLSLRMLESIRADVQAKPAWLRLLRTRRQRSRLQRRVAAAPWSWRSLAVVLPEQHQQELVDLIPDNIADLRLTAASRDSLTDRHPAAFGARAMELLEHELRALLACAGGEEEAIETLLSLAPRLGHPGNADWLHARLQPMNMAARDSTWSIATYGLDEFSPAYQRLTELAASVAAGSPEIGRLAALALAWLLTSPNRFLRDQTSKTLVEIFKRHLPLAASLVQVARDVDDVYVQERILTCAYGALLIVGREDQAASTALVEGVAAWRGAGLPVDVIARDSAHGIASWCHYLGWSDEATQAASSPPYGAPPPDEPPSREELERDWGPIKDDAGNYVEWRASSILHSCLDWYGDFNKYVVKSDVEFFSLHPLDGPSPFGQPQDANLAQVDVDWAGRWIANRAIELGWTPERFETFERNSRVGTGREAHKAERFGKKYGSPDPSVGA